MDDIEMSGDIEIDKKTGSNTTIIIVIVIVVVIISCIIGLVFLLSKPGSTIASVVKETPTTGVECFMNSMPLD